jgi:hypothetical protein
VTCPRCWTDAPVYRAAVCRRCWTAAPPELRAAWRDRAWRVTHYTETLAAALDAARERYPRSAR